MLIEKHISWIALNNVIGCPNKCKYCFLGDKVGVAPKKICEAEEAIELLLANKLYDAETPIAVMVNTDIFATPGNIKECFKVLDTMARLNLPNQIILVTKRLITIEHAEKLRKFIDEGLDIIVYISYSGLPEEFEQGNHYKGIPYATMSMKNLHLLGIPVVHYWRPLMPQNSTQEVIERVFDDIYPYCKGSIITGLKLYDHMSCEDYWPEAQKAFNKNKDVECFFPKKVLKRIKKLAKEYDYPIYVDNFCMLAYLKGEACQFGLYKSKRCKKYSYCPYHNLKNNPCKSCNINKEKTCQKNYWGNSLSNKGWKEI